MTSTAPDRALLDYKATNDSFVVLLNKGGTKMVEAALSQTVAKSRANQVDNDKSMVCCEVEVAFSRVGFVLDVQRGREWKERLISEPVVAVRSFLFFNAMRSLRFWPPSL
jgi:hypothetical protein